MDEGKFHQLLERFVNVTDFWNDHLKELNAASESHPEEETRDTPDSIFIKV
jgi:hypothetical protein